MQLVIYLGPWGLLAAVASSAAYMEVLFSRVQSHDVSGMAGEHEQIWVVQGWKTDVYWAWNMQVDGVCSTADSSENRQCISGYQRMLDSIPGLS